MSGLRACIRKELLLLSRDLHGLALLFLMPLMFIVVMSLALQNQMADRAGGKLKILVLDQDRSPAVANVMTALAGSTVFEFVTPQPLPSEPQIQQQLRRGDYAFALRFPAQFAAQLSSANNDARASLIVEVAPDSGKQTEAIFIGAVRAALSGARLRAVLDAIGGAPGMPGKAAFDNGARPDLLVRYAYSSQQAIPSAVQQSVPAWLVFASFFVVVPLSTTLIRERQQGTLRRLRSTNLGVGNLLLGKLIPYFGINQLQVVLMLLAGRYLVPALGGDALYLNGSWPLLAIMSVSVSLAALGLALLIAVISSTTEQATLLGGTGNIVLAAIGGIMVPKFVMPIAMQNIARWSPMSWGLEGFLDVLLRQGSLRDIAPEAIGLTALGLAAILAALVIQSRRAD